MRNNTFYGIVIGLTAIFVAFILEGGDVKSLFLISPLLIVIVGTLAAGFAGVTWKIFSRFFKLISIAMNPTKYDKKNIALEMVQVATVVRRLGLLSIEDNMEKYNAVHPYMKKLFQVCIDGIKEEELIELYELEISQMTERHTENINMFNKFAGFSPTMGIIGTVMGLISTMAAAGSDPNELIHHIGVAFLATLWGIVMANLVWLPIADKLQVVHNDEVSTLNLIYEGVKSIVSGENPTTVYMKLSCVFPMSEQGDFQNEARKVVAKSRQMIADIEQQQQSDVIGN